VLSGPEVHLVRQNKGLRYRLGVPEDVFFGKSKAFWGPNAFSAAN